MKLGLFIILWGWSHVATAANVLCETRETYLREALARRQSVVETLRQVLVSHDPRVIFFGETHGKICGAGKGGYASLLHSLKRLGFLPDCVFLEAPPTGQTLIDDFVAGRISYGAIARTKNLAAAQEELLLYARANRVRVWAVDPREGLSSLTTDVFARNRRMAQEVTRRMNSQCLKAAFPVGSSHLSISAPPRYLSLPEEIPHVPSANIFIEARGCDIHPEFFWKDCRWNPPVGFAQYGFIPARPSPPMVSRSFEFREVLPHWDAFAAVLVQP